MHAGARMVFSNDIMRGLPHLASRRNLLQAVKSKGAASQSVIVHLHSIATSPSPYPNLLPPSSLGLSQLVKPAGMESARQLPEVSFALQTQTDLVADERIAPLERAAEVFEEIMAGGEEHRAVLALLADALNDAGRHQDAANSAQKLLVNVIESPTLSREDAFGIYLALSKAQFHGGQLDEAAETANFALSVASEVDDSSLAALRQGIALNCAAICKFASISYADDATADDRKAVDVLKESQEMIRMGKSLLFRNDNAKSSTFSSSLAAESTLLLASAASSINEGVAEILHSSLHSRLMGVNIERPPDAAIKAWRDGISVIRRIHPASGTIPLASCIMARLHSNVAASLLQPDGGLQDKGVRSEQKMDENSLTAASESARTALKLCDEIIDAAMNTDQAEATRRSLRSLSGRSLRLVADCYACAGSAVTAEGLYQSSLASLELGNPLSSIERRLVYKSYSSLCSKWDKRTGDADKMEAKSGEVEAEMSESWKCKPAILAGVWMFSQGDFMLPY